MLVEDLNKLEYSWTADVKLYNNMTITIWWTALYSMRASIKEVLSVSSDYPKFRICDSTFLS